MYLFLRRKILSDFGAKPAGWGKQGKGRTIISSHSIQAVQQDQLTLHCKPTLSCCLLLYWQGELSQLTALQSSITEHCNYSSCKYIQQHASLSLLPASLSSCKHPCLKITFCFLLKRVRGKRKVFFFFTEQHRFFYFGLASHLKFLSNFLNFLSILVKKRKHFKKIINNL